MMLNKNFLLKIVIVFILLCSLSFSFFACVKGDNDDINMTPKATKDPKYIDKDKEGNEHDNEQDEIKKNFGDRLLWQYIIEDTFFYYSSPVLSSDKQTIYIGTGLRIAQPQYEDDKLLALNKNGTLKWEFKTNGGEIRSKITLYRDYLYFIADFGRHEDKDFRESAMLFCVDSNGKEVWKQKIAGSSTTKEFGLAEICAYQDKILIVTDYLYVFDYDSGNQSHKSSNSLQDDDRMEYVRPKINSTKATFIVEGNLFDFYFDTNELISYDLYDIAQYKDQNKMDTYSISFDEANNLYVGCGQMFISLDSEKKLRWKLNMSDLYENGTEIEEGWRFRNTPAIDEGSNRVYAGNKAVENSKFFALNMDTGAIEWSVDTGGDLYSSPLIYNDRIYVGSEGEYNLHVYKMNGEIDYELICYGTSIVWTSVVIDSGDGILYVGNMRGGENAMGRFFAINIKDS